MNKFHVLNQIFICFLIIFKIVNCVVVTDIQLLSSYGKNDFAIAGESFFLSCSYLLDTHEVIKFVQWDLNGMVIYIYMPDLNQPIASRIFKNRVDYSNKSTHTMSIRNATKEMAGNYTCHVFTNLTNSAVTVSKYIHVVLDTCSQQNWKTHSDMVNCKEEITFSCKSMFPKPIPSCGLYNDYTGSLIKSYLVDKILPNPDHTYNVSVYVWFNVFELRSLNAPLSFKCKFIIEDTSWQRTFVHSMYSESVCLLDNERKSLKSFLTKKNNFPLALYDHILDENQVTILKEYPACLIGFREGTLIQVNCVSNKPILLCLNATWIKVSEDETFIKQKVLNKEKVIWSKLKLNRHASVKCDSSNNLLNKFIFISSFYIIIWNKFFVFN